MRYLAVALFVTFFAVVAVFYDYQNKEKKIVTALDIDPRLDLFTRAEIARAVRFAHEEYDRRDSLTISIKCVDSAEEAVDTLDGKKIFTGVSLSENGDTLFICPMFFRLTKGPDKTLYNTVLDELILN